MNHAGEPQTNTDFELQSPPPMLRGLNALVDKLGITAPKLTPEHLTRAASRRSGLPPVFSKHVEIGLEVLCRSLRDDAKLHWFGRMNARHLIVTGLAELLLLEEIFRRNPELETVKLNPPLIVTGLPRSGTTFLHRLLASAEEAEPIPLYRHLFPTPRRLPTRLLEASAMFKAWKIISHGYNMDAMHVVHPKLPDECNLGMRLGMHSVFFWISAPVYGYLRWLLDQDMRETYQLYRRILILQQVQAPNKRLTLKCPSHLLSLSALHEALPEAQIVQTHRDPLEIVPNVCSMIVSLHGMGAAALDRQQSIAHNYLKLHAFAKRSVAFADTSAGKRIMHVDYRQLVQNPVQLACDVHDHFGLIWDAGDQSALENFFSANQQYKHGKHHYNMAQIGLDPKVVKSDFREYYERFLSGGDKE